MKCLHLKIITPYFKKCSMGQEAKFIYGLNSTSGPRAYTFEGEVESPILPQSFP